MEPLIFSPFRLSDLKLCHKNDRFEAKRYQYCTIHYQFLTSACDRRQAIQMSLFIQNYRGKFVLYPICPRISLSSKFLKTSDSAKNQRMRFNASFRCLPKRNNSVFPWYGGTCESNAKHHHSGHPEEENVVARLHQVQREKSTADKKICNFRSFTTYVCNTDNMKGHSLQVCVCNIGYQERVP
jgi:hypothetical protein